MKKIKVLIHLSSLTCGGGEKALVNMLNSLPEDKYDITLQLFRNDGTNMQFLPSYVHLNEALFPDGFPSKRARVKFLLKKFDIKGLAKSIWYFIKSRKTNSRQRDYYEWLSMKPFCRPNRERYDVAIAAMHGVSTYYVLDMIQADKKICWVHTDYSKIPQVREEQKYFEKADKIITVSEQCYTSFKLIYPHLDNVVMLYNLNCPKLIEQMAEEKSKEQCFPDKKEWHFVSLGRLTKLKGFDMLVEAAKGLKERGVSFAWYVLGEGAERQTLENQARTLCVNDCVFFIGIASNPYPYIKWADIIVQTSRYEGKSMVLDEAKIMNKPIVSTSYDSVRDQIEDGKTGILVPVSSNGIEEGIHKLVSAPLALQALSLELSHTDKEQKELIEKYEALIEGTL